MRKTVVSAIACALILSPTPALAASDPDLCNWVPTTNEIQAGVSTRLEDGTLIWLGPGFCTDPGDEVLRWFANEGLSFQVKWRDPVRKWSGTLWVDGPRIIHLAKTGHKMRILDVEVDEKTDR